MPAQTKRILMIADADSIWTKRYIEHVLLPAEYEVVVFPIYTYQGKFLTFYQQNHILLYEDQHRLPIIRYIPRIRMWVRIFLNAQKLRLYGPYDAVHCHYISQRDLALGALVARHDGAIFLAKSLGSDVLRVSASARKKMKKPLRYAKAVNTSSRQSAEVLIADCGPEIAEKTFVLNYGASEYEVIDQIRKTKSKMQCRQEIGALEGNYIISLGSNASTGQQQLEMLLAIKELPDEILSKITFLFIHSYGMNQKEYIDRIHSEAEKIPSQVIFVNDYLSTDKYAVYQIATDLFVLGAVTDTFSYTLREYLYAGSAALKGEWLTYDELTELGIHVQSYSGFDTLPAAVQEIMHNHTGRLTEKQRELLYNNFSWEKQRSKWLALYQ